MFQIKLKEGEIILFTGDLKSADRQSRFHGGHAS